MALRGDPQRQATRSSLPRLADPSTLGGSPFDKRGLSDASSKQPFRFSLPAGSPWPRTGREQGLEGGVLEEPGRLQSMRSQKVGPD